MKLGDNFDRAEHLKDVVDQHRGLNWALLKLLSDELGKDPKLELAVYALLDANRAQDDKVEAVAEAMIAEWRDNLRGPDVRKATTCWNFLDFCRKIRMKSRLFNPGDPAEGPVQAGKLLD